MQEIVQSSAGELSFGLVLSLGTTLVAGSGGIHALIDGINLAYDQKETRNYFKVRLLAIVLTIAVVMFTVASAATIAVLPHVLHFLGLEPLSRLLLQVGRWPALGVAVMVGLSLLYRYAPNRTRPTWHWLSFGAVLATVVWLIASACFAGYAASFANYNKTYGALAGIVVFMLWIYISTLAVLLGAELNAELERRGSSRANPRPTTSDEPAERTLVESPR